MKYTTEITIDLPVDRVITLFDNADNLKKWMEGLESFEHLSGTPGEVGAKSKLVYKTGKRKMVQIETITVKNLPHEFSGTYEANGVFNVVNNFFSPLDGNKTKYYTEHEFQFKGVMKLVAWLMPGVFKKQSMKYLIAFKKFAESQS